MSRLRRFPPLFWIGLLPVVILLWAWAETRQHTPSWSYSGEWNRLDMIAAYQSKLRYHRMEVSEVEKGARVRLGTPSGIMTGRFGRFSNAPLDPASGKAAWFPPLAPVTWEQRDAWGGLSYVTSYVELPFWVILLGYLPLWLSLSVWQARRRKKKIEAGMPVAVAERGEI